MNKLITPGQQIHSACELFILSVVISTDRKTNLN